MFVYRILVRKILIKYLMDDIKLGTFGFSNIDTKLHLSLTK